MSSLTVFDHLVMHLFLADLAAGWLHRLTVRAGPVTWPAGRRVFREDARAGHSWLLRTGIVAFDFRVPGRSDVVIQRIGAGGVIGWSWLVNPHRWALGAVAAEDCPAVEFDARGARALIAEDPEPTARFLAVMAERLQAVRGRLVELYAYPDDPARTTSRVPTDQWPWPGARAPGCAGKRRIGSGTGDQ
jgi:CRP/FNR family cyclic AMP-dependent transcriptional regulator